MRMYADLQSGYSNIWLVHCALSIKLGLQTMRAPKEFFDRRRHMYDRIMEQLKKNDQSLLIEMLGATAS